MKRLLTAFILSTSLIRAQASFADYNLNDLNALETQNAYKEFFDHFKDIRPSERDENYQKLVIRMGEAYLKSISEKESIEDTEIKELSRLEDIPFLKETEFFKLRRRTTLTKYIKNCFKENYFDSCVTKTFELIHPDEDSFELLYEVGEILRKNGRKYPSKIALLDLWPFYEKALASNLAEFYCSEDIQNEIILKKIEQSDFKINESQKKPLLIIQDSCLIKLKENFISYFFKENSGKRESIFTFLISTNKLTKLELSFMGLFYILTTTTTGPLLDYSWREVQKLKTDFKKRDLVIKKIEKLDPLPGTIFNYTKDKRIALVIDFIYKNIPEYIDLYSKTCLDYLSNNKKFEKGNPTPYCDSLFMYSKENNLLPPLVIERFNKLKKFDFSL